MNLIEIHVSETIARLNYDFRQFSLEHFLGHLLAVRQRDIILKSYPFELSLGGVWVRAETADYVFFNGDTPQFHQVHHVLHELGHIVLEHVGQKLTPEALKQLGLSLDASRGKPLYALYRTTGPGRNLLESEAETFVRLMQWEILQADRMVQLTGPSSSLETVSLFTRSLGYNE